MTGILAILSLPKKKQAIYIPDDWYSLVRETRQKNPFSVCEMKSEDFVSIKSLKLHIVNRKVNTQASSELDGDALDKSI